MNCPNCKNPVQANNTACEWCGTQLINNEAKESVSSATNKPTNWKDISSRRKVVLIILAILVFLFIYLQINPLT